MNLRENRSLANDATAAQSAFAPSPALIGSAIVAALGGFLFGFDTAVISGTTEALKTTYGLNENSLGFTVAIALIGTIVGSILAGKPADFWGRRRVLMVLAVLYFVGALGSALAWNWYAFVAFRLLGGLAVGGASVVSPMYIAEISPAQLRGRLVAIQQLNIVLGILAAFLSNYLVAQLNLGDPEWRWMLGIQVVPAALFFLLLFPTPESPRWLVARSRVDEARAVFTKIGFDGSSIEEELADIQRSLDLEHHEQGDALFQAKYKKPIFLAVAIAMFNQLSGINALMYYAAKIFAMAGAGKGSALLAIGRRRRDEPALHRARHDRHRPLRPAQADSHRFGRLPDQPGGHRLGLLHLRDRVHADRLSGCTGESALVHRGACVRTGGGDLGLHQRDLSEPRRAQGQALGTTTHWVMAALITWTFPLIASSSGGHAFAFYAAMMFLQLLWALFLMPETKGVPLEEIQRKLGIE